MVSTVTRYWGRVSLRSTTRSALRTAMRGSIFVLLLALGSGCADEQQEDELKGSFGTGSVGVGLSSDPPATVSFVTSTGAAYGFARYDAAYFFPIEPADTAAGTFGSFSNAAGEIVLSMARISGRPDTPCRFQAAVLARDEGFNIEASGDRKNAAGIEFHQVDLNNGTQFLSFYCATLSGNSGVLILSIMADKSLRDSIQLKFVLNSVR